MRVLNHNMAAQKSFDVKCLVQCFHFPRVVTVNSFLFVLKGQFELNVSLVPGQSVGGTWLTKHFGLDAAC